MKTILGAIALSVLVCPLLLNAAIVPVNVTATTSETDRFISYKDQERLHEKAMDKARQKADEQCQKLTGGGTLLVSNFYPLADTGCPVAVTKKCTLQAKDNDGEKRETVTCTVAIAGCCEKP